MIVLSALYIITIAIEGIHHTNGTVAIVLFTVLLMFIYKKRRSK